jgi:hypothetical protein
MKIDILKAALFTPMADGRWGLPIMFWGPPGVAKTAAMRALARRCGWYLEHLTPGERGEGAFGVVPVPVHGAHGTVISYPSPDWVDGFERKDKEAAGVCFLDEINTAPPALQPALLGALQERRIGGAFLGARVRMVGAANPTGHAAAGWDLAAPVANRMGHLDWPVIDTDTWTSWLMNGAVDDGAPVDADAEEARVMAEWPQTFAHACGLIAAFVRRRPELLHKMPNDGDPAQGRAWPSPRTWEYATRAFASAKLHGLSEDDSEEFVAAFVGPAAAGELYVWLREADLPDPAELLDGRVKFEADKRRPDRTEAVLNACIAIVAPANAAKRDDRSRAFWKLSRDVMGCGKDAVTPAVKRAIDAGLQRLPEAREVLAGLFDVLNAAGVR